MNKSQEEIQSERDSSGYDAIKNSIMQLKIRDFIYMDIERLKSIISQSEKGIVNAFTTKQTSAEFQPDLKSGFSTKFLWENQETESKSFHDYIYNKVEEILRDSNKVLMLSDVIQDQEAYIKQFRNNQSDTDFVLVRGHVYINDFSHICSIIENWKDFSNFIIKCSTISSQQSKSDIDRKKMLKDLKEQTNVIDKDFVKGFKVLFELFYKDRLVIKILPFKGFPDFRLVGNLNKEFFRDDISSITYKYGTAPVSKWTVFAQIASIPPKDRSDNALSMIGDHIEAAFQQIFNSLRNLEGSVQSVVYPEIAVTPIAIYRE